MERETRLELATSSLATRGNYLMKFDKLLLLLSLKGTTNINQITQNYIKTYTATQILHKVVNITQFVVSLTSVYPLINTNS